MWLQELGANVTGISLRPTCQPNLFEAAAVDENMRSLYIDIRNVDALKKAFSETQPEIIIHMAAQSLVRKSYHDPVETYSTNVMGTVNVLEAVRYSPSVRAVVNVTSDKCYENNDDFRPFVESDRMGAMTLTVTARGVPSWSLRHSQVLTLTNINFTNTAWLLRQLEQEMLLAEAIGHKTV